MAALTGEELVDEVRALTGRDDDTVLCTTARILRFLNTAQEKITKACPGLPCRYVEDISGWQCVTTSNQFSLASLADGSWVPAHVHEVWYRNGSQGHQMDFMPKDEFDENYPDPTDTDDYSPGKPVRWTIKGQAMHVAPFPSSDYKAAALGEATGHFRVVYTAFPMDLSNNSTVSDLSQADEGLIMYAVAEAWGAIGKEDKRAVWKQKYQNWLAEYFDDYATMSAWDNNILTD